MGFALDRLGNGLGRTLSRLVHLPGSAQPGRTDTGA